MRLGIGLFVLAVLLPLLARCAGSAPGVQDTDDPTLVATYGDHKLHTDEYLREYQRNSSLVEAGSDDAEEFLDRYVNYRLKVLAAEAARYDQDPELQAEIHTYRASFARPYLVDRKVMAPILLDFYEKKKQFVHASHIFARVQPQLGAGDSVRAMGVARALRDSVLAGILFGDVAMMYSEDQSASDSSARQGFRGDLGWFTAGSMIQAFEDQAYTVPLGEMSEVFRTDYGYHVLMVHDRVPAVPPIRLSQILVRIKDTAPESLAVAREKIEQAQARINAGQNFAFVAGEMSEEENSARRGGDIGTISYHRRGIDSTFRVIAFGIENVGDVTDIIRTGYGFQILKLTARDELGTFEEEYDDLRRQVQYLPRMIRAEEELAKEARSRHIARLDSTVLTSLVSNVARDSVREVVRGAAANDSLAGIVIGQVDDSVYTVRHLGLFAGDRNNRIRNGQTTDEQVINIGNAFLDYAAITHAALELEHEDEEFSWIMANFRDGLLLFKLMEDSVWAAAANDSLAIRAHFEANQERYRFGPRHRLMEVFAYDDSVHQAAIYMLDQGMSWADFYEQVHRDSVVLIRFDTVFVEGPTNSIYDRAIGIEAGQRSEVIPYRSGFVAVFNDGMEPERAMTFEEARAAIITDRQELLEQQLVARLRSRYRVVTYPERAKAALAEL